jgi:O-antigen ligase
LNSNVHTKLRDQNDCKSIEWIVAQTPQLRFNPLALQSIWPLVPAVLALGVALFVSIGYISPGAVALAMAGSVLTLVLVRYAEVAFVLFLSAGWFKADPRLSFLQSLDLTLVFAVCVAIAIIKRQLKGYPLQLPRSFLLYLPLIFLMLGSLFYTPDFAAGADKAGRFLFLTGLAIVAPFAVLDSPAKLDRFFLTFPVIGVLMSINSFSMLGGHERLVAPSGENTQLGEAAALGIVSIWFLLLPRQPFHWRVLSYGAVLVLIVALIGSGSRGPTVGLVCCILVSFILYKRLLLDVALITSSCVLVLPRVHIPDFSYKYLGTLIRYVGDTDSLLSMRKDLMQLGWQLTLQHPWLGVGIAGYPFYSPLPNRWNWPHNLLLELGSELGVIAPLVVCCLFVCAFWASFKQVIDEHFPHRRLCGVVLGFLVFGLINILNKGNINDHRVLWLSLGLPFLLRQSPFQGSRCDSNTISC